LVMRELSSAQALDQSYPTQVAKAKELSAAVVAFLFYVLNIF